MDRNEPGVKKGQVYVKPQLVEFGAIEKLTQSGKASNPDGGHVSQAGAPPA